MTSEPRTAPRRAVVLAAGKGTRLRAAVPDRPKPLVVVGGETVLEHNLRELERCGVREVWINLHYRGEQIEELVGSGSRYGLEVRYSREPELLGTAGAVKKLERELDGGTFLVVYGDNLTTLAWEALVARHRASGALGTLAVFDQRSVPNVGLAGGRVVVDDRGRIERFVEGGPCPSPWVNAGIYVLEPSILRHIPQGFSDFGKDVFPALLEAGVHLGAHAIRGWCLAVDTPEALRRAEELLRTTPGRRPPAADRQLEAEPRP